MERSLPARLVEDVEEDVAHEADALADALLVDLVGGGFKGPVDEHGAAYDVFSGDEAPETAVEAFGTVVAHGEDLAGRHDEVAVDDVGGESAFGGKSDRTHASRRRPIDPGRLTRRSRGITFLAINRSQTRSANCG